MILFFLFSLGSQLVYLINLPFFKATWSKINHKRDEKTMRGKVIFFVVNKVWLAKYCVSPLKHPWLKQTDRPCA